MKNEERIARAFDIDPVLILGDHRPRWRKVWDKLPWSWRSRAIRRWKREYGRSIR